MGFKAIKTEKLNSLVGRIDIKAPLIAKKARAGQFVVIRIDEKGERIPLTIAFKDKERGTISIIYQVAGKTTQRLACIKDGEEILDLIGPLGEPSDFGKKGKILFVGGGVGIAEILPVIKYATEHNNEVTTILGARTSELLILKDEIEALSSRTLLTTDDGSAGEKGVVIEPLRNLLNKEEFDLCYAVGPDVMMRAVCDTTKSYKLKTLVSLDANMVDATGMCGTCRVTVSGKVKFTCVDGPEFDGHQLDWDEFLSRQKRFIKEEKQSEELYHKKHLCQRQSVKSKPQREE